MLYRYIDMKKLTLNNVKLGDWVRLVRNGHPTKKTYQRGHYDRATKTYSLTDIDNINGEVFRKSSTAVFLDCEF